MFYFEEIKGKKFLKSDMLPAEHFFTTRNSVIKTKEKEFEPLVEENKKIIPVNLKRNLGGAGGFNAGLKNFINNSDSDYISLISTGEYIRITDKMIQEESIINNSWGSILYTQDNYKNSNLYKSLRKSYSIKLSLHISL